MFDTKIFEDLAQKLSNALPSNAQDAKQDIEKNFRHILQGTFSKLDLVTREEFDTQTKVLARTREKLEKIEQELNHLEETLGGNSAASEKKKST